MRLVGPIAVVLAGVLISAASAQSFSVGTGGSDVRVRLDDRLSSQDTVRGQRFSFETTETVMIAGRTVPAGTLGDGVVDAVRTGHGRNAGSLAISVKALHPADGPAIVVALPDAETGLRSPGQVGTHRGSVLVGAARDGTNVVYERGMRFAVVVPAPDELTPSPSPAPASSPR